jgi:hypothetical protein
VTLPVTHGGRRLQWRDVIAGAAVLLAGVAGAVWGEGAGSETSRKPDGAAIRPD